jgi:hypothetical protein
MLRRGLVAQSALLQTYHRQFMRLREDRFCLLPMVTAMVFSYMTGDGNAPSSQQESAFDFSDGCETCAIRDACREVATGQWAARLAAELEIKRDAVRARRLAAYHAAHPDKYAAKPSAVASTGASAPKPMALPAAATAKKPLLSSPKYSPSLSPVY